MSRRGFLLTALLWCTALIAGLLVWLPLTRGATQGPAYSWALSDSIGGRGVGGDYWMLVIAAGFVLSLLYLGWRGARQPFHWLLLTLWVPLAGIVVWAVASDPESVRIEGATVGLNLSLAVIAPLFFGAVAIAAVVWVVRDLRSGMKREIVPWVWTPAAILRAILVVAIVPVEVILFRSGGIQSTPNMIGVALVGWQWVMLNLILAGAR